MLRLFPLALLLSATPALAADDDEFDPADVSIADAINCYVDAPTYNSFAMAIVGEDNLAARLGWRKIESDNPFLAEYELPEPELITGHWSTRRVAFSSSAVLAILDVADPNEIAAGEDIMNEVAGEETADASAAAGPKASAAGFRKFLGQRVLADVTEPANDADSFGTRTVIARSISNVTTHPGKTLYGCSYRIELLDREGNPL